MKPKVLLRIAAIVMFLHVIGHTMGALTWKQAPNAVVSKVIAGMQQEHFDFMGRSASLGRFFEGYGLIFIFILLFLTVQLWIFSSEPSKKLLWPMTALLTVQACLEWYYFFPLAAIMSYVAAACCALTIRQLSMKDA